jgi:hypothetical protein
MVTVLVLTRVIVLRTDQSPLNATDRSRHMTYNLQL